MNQSDSPDRNAPLLRLYSKSPLKQRKFREISELLPEHTNLKCLDIGSDNGVISLLLRKRGGEWTSADLIPETVEAIRSVVGERVDRIDGRTTPYANERFDLIVIVDFLEHISTDREFIVELARISKSGATLIVNVPNPRRGLLRWVRKIIGQTDAAHGHLRPGYSLEELTQLLAPNFVIESHNGYSKFFSELADTVITAAMDCLKKISGGKKRGQKGTIVTALDMRKMGTSFKIFSLIYPFMALMVQMDALLFWMRGSMLIVRARRR